MKNKHETTPHYKNILLISLADLNTAGRAETAEAAELLLQAVTFLARYSFLLEPATEEADFLKPKNAPAGEIHAQNAYVARYLDSKYSRWISTDPALGEYIPAAGKGNSENAGNLPGVGGIYNHINGDLYHYAGNNPVRYIDPDGRKTESGEVQALIDNIGNGANLYVPLEIIDRFSKRGWKYIGNDNLTVQELNTELKEFANDRNDG